MGLFTWLFGKKETGTGHPPDSLNPLSALLAAAEIGANAKTGPQARQAWSEMAAVLERGGRDHGPTRALAARLHSMAAQIGQAEDAVAVEACSMLTRELTATAQRLEAAQSRMSGR